MMTKRRIGDDHILEKTGFGHLKELLLCCGLNHLWWVSWCLWGRLFDSINCPKAHSAPKLTEDWLDAGSFDCSQGLFLDLSMNFYHQKGVERGEVGEFKPAHCSLPA